MRLPSIGSLALLLTVGCTGTEGDGRDDSFGGSGAKEDGAFSTCQLAEVLKLVNESTSTASKLEDLDATYEKVLDEIRAQYQLGYASTNKVADGGWRAVEVKIKRNDLRVRTRKGYFAPYKPSR